MDVFTEQIDSYSPQTKQAKPSSTQSQPKYQPPQQNPYIADSVNYQQKLKAQKNEEKKPQEYYKQYFQVSQDQVKGRIMGALIPPFKEELMQGIQEKPDFYGPFWIINTIICLLVSVINIADYFYSKIVDNKAYQQYFFRLELLRNGVVLMYIAGIVVPVTLFFIFKFIGKPLKFQELICLYGYSLSCFIPGLILCILPIQILHWLIIMIYCLGCSTLVMYVNLKKYMVGPKQFVILGVIVILQVILCLCVKMIFIQLSA